MVEVMLVPPPYNINILYFEIQWRKAIFCNDKARMNKLLKCVLRISLGKKLE